MMMKICNSKPNNAKRYYKHIFQQIAEDEEQARKIGANANIGLRIEISCDGLAVLRHCELKLLKRKALQTLSKM